MIGSAHEPRQDGRERRALCGQKSWEEQKSVLFPRFPSEVEDMRCGRSRGVIVLITPFLRFLVPT